MAAERSLGDIAHDLRTPLSVIESSAEAALEDPALSPAARDTLELIRTQVERLSEIASEIALKEV